MSRDNEITDLIGAGFLVAVAGTALYLVCKAFNRFEAGAEVTEDEVSAGSHDDHHYDPVEKEEENACSICGRPAAGICSWCDQPTCRDCAATDIYGEITTHFNCND